MGYYLMIKEAVGLGVKYLCKCGDYKDPYAYTGSGVFWRKIINKHKCEIHTTIIGYYESKEELKAAGEYYSLLYNIVNDRQWANIIPEIGDGGPTTTGKIYAYDPITKKTKSFYRDESIPDGWLLGQPPKGPRPADVTDKIVKSQTGQKRSDDTRQRMKNAVRKKRKTVECEYCSKSITLQNLKRHMEKTHGK